MVCINDSLQQFYATVSIAWTQVVFPNPKHSPTCLPKRPGDEPVPALVPGQLASPEDRVLPGLRRVLIAAMPKTAVNEYGQPQLGKDEIRTNAEIFSFTAPGRRPE